MSIETNIHIDEYKKLPEIEQKKYCLEKNYSLKSIIEYLEELQQLHQLKEYLQKHAPVFYKEADVAYIIDVLIGFRAAQVKLCIKEQKQYVKDCNEHRNVNSSQ